MSTHHLRLKAEGAPLAVSRSHPRVSHSENPSSPLARIIYSRARVCACVYWVMRIGGEGPWHILGAPSVYTGKWSWGSPLSSLSLCLASAKAGQRVQGQRQESRSLGLQTRAWFRATVSGCRGKRVGELFSGGALRKGRRMVIDWDITHTRAREVRQRRERLSPVEGRFVLFSRSRWEREVVLFEEGRRKSFSSGFLIGEGVHTPSCVLGEKLNNGVWEVSGDWPWNWKFTDNVQVEKIMRPDTDPCYETIEALIFRWN